MKSHAKMSHLDRAKQFSPFAALKGYETALRVKEKVLVPRIELSEEAQAELDRKLHMIAKGDLVTVIYFHRFAGSDVGEYLQITGRISKIELERRMLRVQDRRILTDDIYSIERNTSRFINGSNYKRSYMI